MDKLHKKFTLLKKLKFIQLVLLIISSIFFLYLYITSRTLHEILFTEKELTAFCILIWLMLLFFLISNIVDFAFCRTFVLSEHQLNRFFYLDPLTGIPDRKSLDSISAPYRTPEKILTLGCCLMAISGLEDINKNGGRGAGDKLLSDFSQVLESAGDSFGLVSRNGGNAFLCLIQDCNIDKMQHFLASLQNRLSEYNLKAPLQPLHVNYAFTLNHETKISDFSDILSVTYKKLFAHDEEKDGRGFL